MAYTISQRNSVPSAHALSLLIVVTIASLAVFFQISGHSFSDWADAVSYQATGKYLIEYMQLMPAPIGIEMFLASGGESFGKEVVNYPNFAFSTLLGLLGWLRGDYSLVNGVLSGLGFSVLLGISCYALMYTVVRSHVMAVVFVFAILFQKTILANSGRPLSDIALLFFFSVAVHASIKDRLFLSGIILGFGYLFREHALMFLPFIPLLSPDANSLSRIIKGELFTIAGFLPFVLASSFYYWWILDGHTQPDYYMSVYATWLDRWFSLEAIGRLFSNLRFYWSEFGLVLRIFLVWGVIRFFKLSQLQKACLVIGILLSFVPCFMWTAQQKVPIRYGIYTILLFHVAMASMLPRVKYRSAIYVVIILVAVFQNLPRHINERSLLALMEPVRAVERVMQELRSPTRMSSEFDSGAVILTDDAPLAYITLTSPVTVDAPSYEVFLSLQGNEQFDGIVMRRGKEGWGDAPDRITDAFGISFERIPPKSPSFPEKLAYYRRVQAAQGAIDPN